MLLKTSEIANSVNVQPVIPEKTNVAQTAEIPALVTTQHGISEEIIDELSNEINNMLSFAIYNGIIINTEVNVLIQNSNVDDLINAHNLLCKNIAPATPKSINYTKKLYEERNGKPLLNKLSLVRNLIILSLLFLTTFIFTGLSPSVNNDSLDKRIMENSGLSLLLN